MARQHAPQHELTAADAHALVDATRLIAGTVGRSLDDTLDALMDHARRLLDAEGAVLLLATDDPEVFQRLRPTSLARPGDPRSRPGPARLNAFSRSAIATRQPVFTADFQSDERIPSDVKQSLPGVRAGMTTPLLAEGELVGLFSAHWSRPFQAGPREHAVAEALGNQAAIAIRTGHALEAERAARTEAEAATARAAIAHELLCTLVEAAADAQVADGEDEIYEIVGQAVVRAGLSAHLTTVDRVRNVLVVRQVALVGDWLTCLERLLGRTVPGIELPIDEMPQYQAVVRERRTVLDRNAVSWMYAAAPWIPRSAARAVARLLRLRQAIAAPIVDGGIVVGVLSVWGEALSEEDVPTIELLGRLAGGAIEGSRLRAAESARAEEAQRARAELEAIMDAAADTIVVFRSDGSIAHANPRAWEQIRRLLGGEPATAHTLYRAASTSLIDTTPTGLRAVERALAGEAVEELLTWRTRDHRQLQLHVVATPVRDADGAIWGVVVVARDMGVVREVISEPARIEGAVLTARLVAHELNTKLQLVTGYGTLLQRRADPETRELVERMVDGAEEAARIVARLQQIIRVAVTDAGGGPMLDLEAATTRR